MGRWTPLILMAGGLAILLGTLLGISFPMGGQNTAQAPAPTTTQRPKESKVLPANIDVNSTAAGNGSAEKKNNIAAQTNQNSETNNKQKQDDDTGAANNQPTGGQSSGNNQSSPDTNQNQNNEPIRALW
ncbi:hypothetical protein [Brasilonema bromeliae]|uniref:Uncharacterized protein n=1 Tax=Brasilonema bromeliae SPC951 TaxID=385972 RepID=A0ABX1PDR6_9CYAN|nr:hypothetical protein [Brasilonema bromeliae]NMG22633.1 hypothetical protein [Brasilonema bromeliae SPC951]